MRLAVTLMGYTWNIPVANVGTVPTTFTVFFSYYRQILRGVPIIRTGQFVPALFQFTIFRLPIIRRQID